MTIRWHKEIISENPHVVVEMGDIFDDNPQPIEPTPSPLKQLVHGFIKIINNIIEFL